MKTLIVDTRSIDTSHLEQAKWIETLQMTLSNDLADDGFIIPEQSSANIAKLAIEPTGDKQNGKYYQRKLVIDKDKKALNISLKNGKYEQLQTKLSNNFDSNTPFIDMTTGKLTKNALAFFEFSFWWVGQKPLSRSTGRI